MKTRPSDGLYVYLDYVEDHDDDSERVFLGISKGTPTTGFALNRLEQGQFVSNNLKADAEFAFDMSMTHPSVTDRAAGFSFRMADVNNRYALEWTGRAVELVKYDNGSRVVLAAQAYWPQPNTNYRVKVRTAGSTIEAYINEQKLFTVHDDRFASGSFGMFSAKNGVSFGSIVVKEANVTSSGSQETYFYDPNGNVERMVDRNRQTIVYSYDARDRLKSITTPSESIGWTYDGAGRRLTMTDHTGTMSYRYQGETGELLQVTFPDGKSVGYTYDRNGRRETMTDPFGKTIYYHYDVCNRLDGVGDALGDDDVTYVYSKNGLLKEAVWKNGVTSAYTYDGTRLNALTYRRGSTVIQAFEYDYDANQNIVARTENGVRHTFAYDDLNRIKTSTLYNESYAYNNRGNRVSYQSERVMSVRGGSYEYDGRNHLTKVTTEEGKVVTYSYNGDGLLVERTENGVTTRYYYDGTDVIGESTVSGATVSHVRYVRGKGLVYRQEGNGDKQYYVHNGHGDVVELRDGNGNLINQYAYDIWGNPTSSSEGVKQPFQYSGEFWDETTHLQYLRARWYDPSMGRFMSEDTYEGDLTNPLSLNLYTYVKNNPLRYTDPTGHIPTPLEAAYMTQQIYNVTDDDINKASVSGDWTLIDIKHGTEGMKMGVYSRVKGDGTTEYVLVNKGTTPTSVSDWKNNGQQLFGSSTDMEESIAETEYFSRNHSDNEITMVGHSKGGAEAAANAVATNKNSIIFNPATVNLKAYGLSSSNYSGSMTAFIVKGDILNSAEGWFSKPIDKAVYLPQQFGGHWYQLWQTSLGDRVRNHSMDAVISALKEAGYD